MGRRKFALRKRPDMTTGSRAGYSGTRRATTRSRPWSRNRSRGLAASVAALTHPRLHVSQVLVERCLLVGGEDCADLSGLLGLNVHHLGAGRLVRRTTRCLLYTSDAADDLLCVD